MAGWWEQDPAVEQQSAPGDGGGWWRQDPVVEQRPASNDGWWKQDPAVEDEEERRRRSRIPERPGKDWDELGRAMLADPYVTGPEKPPEAEGMFATGLRAFAHEAPAAAAGAAGAVAGAGLGSAAGPIGTIAGGFAGAVAGGFAGSAATEESLKALGYDDATQRAVNAKENPWSSAIGQGLAQIAGFGAGTAGKVARIGGAAIGGGLEAGQQIYQGEFDPARLATQAAAGAVFNKPYKWGSRLEAQGAALGERVAQRYHGPASSEGANVASEHIPPTTTKPDVGDAHQERGVGSETNYPNPTNARPPEAGGGVHVGDVDPTLKAALDAKTADTAPGPVDVATMQQTADAQVEANRAAAAGRPEAQGRPPMTVPAEDARVTPEMAEAAELRRRVIERGRSGRPIETEPLPIGTEGQILERGAGRAEEGLAPGETPPLSTPATPREAIEQRASGETVGGALREAAAARQQDVLRGPEPGAVGTPPAAPPDTVRFYHGGEDPTSGGPRWLTPDENYARNFRAGDQPNQVHYVDIPREQLGAGYDDINNIYRHFEAPEEIAKQLKPLAAEVGPGPAAPQGGGGGAREPPGGPPGTPPPGAPPPGPPSTGGNAQQSILARIANATPASWRDKIPTNMAEAKDAWRRAYTAAKDDLDPLAQFTKELSQGRSLAAEEDPYKLARMTRGSFGRVEQMLNHGTFDFETGQTNGKSLRDVLAPVKNDMDGLTAYAVAKHAIEVEGRGVKTGIPLPEANSVVAQGAKKYEPAFRELVNYQDRTLDYLQKSGVIGADDVARMRAVNKEFVPFYRLLDPNTELGQQVGTGLKVWDPVRSIKGSEREILNPIESIIKNTHAYVALAERNRALLALEKLASSHPQGDQFMQRVIERHPVKVTPDEINKFMQEQNLPGQTAEAMTVFRPNAFRPAPDQIRLFKDGKSQIYKVDPAIAESVNSLDRDSINTLTRILGAPARLLRAGATLSPEFIVRNPIRDQFSAMANSKYGYVPVYDMAKGLGSLLNKDQIYQQWLKSGGSNAAMVSLDRKLIGLQPTDLASKVENVIRSPIEALRAASELMENSTRLGEFRRAIEQGASPAEAAYSSREVTMDFARMGAKTKALNAIIPFFNAQIEGVDRAARAFKDNPTSFLTKVGLGITLPSTLLWFANKDDPRYRELPQWEKDLFWIVPTDHWTGMTKDQAAGVGDAHKRQLPDGTWQRNDGTIWRIPKPFELGALFGSVPERILDSFFTAHPNSFKDLHKTLWQTLTPNFMPQAASPLIEQFANRSMFLDRPLVPKSLEKVQPKYQETGYTSEVAKTIGGMISSFNKDTSFASPIVIDNYIRQWTGGLGAHALNILDKGLRATGIAPDKVQPEATAADMPLLKAFAARFPAGSAQSVQDFYNTYDERKSAKATDTYLRKSGRDSERTGEPIQVAEGIHKALGNQQKFIRNVYSDMSMSPAEKRQLIDVTYLQMIETARRGNQILNRPTP